MPARALFLQLFRQGVKTPRPSAWQGRRGIPAGRKDRSVSRVAHLPKRRILPGPGAHHDRDSS